MRSIICFAVLATVVSVQSLHAQDEPAAAPARGSLIEDRAARKLVEAGDARFEADEASKAVEVWESVIERYPTSRVRFLAHMRLGNYFLERDRAFEKARVHFESVASEDNRDEDQRAAATLNMGVCFYEARNFGKCFQVMRDVIEKFPVSEHVNQAYYYIGLGHFQLGHYSRAIAALEKVGTALSSDDNQVQKVEAGKRLFVKIEDADLAALEAGQAVKVECQAGSGDQEIVDCFPVGRNVRIVLGSITTKLGRPKPNNGTLEVKGDDKVAVSYVDQHTSDKQFNRKVLHEVTVVGDGIVSITDGAFSETLQGVVLGKTVNVQTSDPDRDLSDQADELTAVVEVYRAKTDEELEAEAIAAVNAADGNEAASTGSTDDGEEEEVDRFKLVDRVDVRLTEAAIAQPISSFSAADLGNSAEAEGEGVAPPGAGEDPGDTSIHSGIFRTTIELARAEEAIADDPILQALPGDIVRVIYQDEKNTTEDSRQVQVDAKCIEGNSTLR